MNGTPGRVVFVGAVHEAAPALSALLGDERADVVAVLTRPRAARPPVCGWVDLARPAVGAGVPVLLTEDVNDPRVVAAVRALRPDLLVVTGWSQLLRTPLLQVPRYGCVGFHASLLPRHRGHAPVNWAILRGETTIGNTMMLLDPGADTGDIVAQREVPVTPEDTCASVYRKIGRAGAAMLRTHLTELLAGSAPRRHQQRAAGDLLPRRTPEMGVLDWNRPPRAVHDWVRAITAPYPGAFTHFRGAPVTVWTTRPPARTEPAGPPGQVLGVEADGVRVGVRGGSVLVTRMSARGARPRPAALWLRERGIPVGARFDPVPPAVARWVRGEGPPP